MLFNSYQFIFLFLPITSIVFFIVARNSKKFAALWLGAASLFFYGMWNPQFVWLLLASIGFNYAMGYAIGHVRAAKQSGKQSKRLLIIGIAFNLLLLGYFKYTNFCIGTVSQIAGAHWGLQDIVLPLGISFFTFTQIAFLVDVHRGIAREYNFTHYLLFVSYFPHLIAGPVLHHKQMMPQFGHSFTYKFNIDNINVGLMIFTIGLFKKVMLADQFALYANPVFNSLSSGRTPSMTEAWVGSLAYTLQLYFDFSGYSDMAVGISKMLNVNLPLNFASPYKAKNIIEFWRRWHMTLSAFLRDYLYIPLGGNRYGVVRRYANLMITMLLGGLWHGANWTFVFWGGLHGVYLVINHGWQAAHKKLGLPTIPGGAAAGCVITFITVVFAWVMFRSNNLDAALLMLKSMLWFNAAEVSQIQFSAVFPYINIANNEFISPAAVIWILIGLVIVWLMPNSQQIVGIELAQNKTPRQEMIFAKQTAMPAILLGILFFVSIITLASGKVSEFLYFQF
ncbi:MAG: MBOAT family protein [Gallionella sp.]|nr:MBOAT family protein [Gallionella sp.]